MVAPSLLVAKNGSTPLRVFRLTGGTSLTQVGGDVTGVANAPSTGHWNTNEIVEFRGRLYFRYTDSSNFAAVARYNPVTDVWDNVFTSPNTETGAGTGRRSGMYIAGIPSPRLFFYCFQDGVGGRLFYTEDGASWTNGVTTTGPNPMGKGVMYRNKLYQLISTNSMAIVDPVANTVSLVANIGSFSANSGGLCVFRNRLYQVAQSGGSGDDVNLYEFTGGAWVFRATILAVSSSSGVNDEGHALIPIGTTKMIAITQASSDGTTTNRGSRAHDLTPTGPTTFSVVDVTSPVIPLALRAPQTVIHRWTGFEDNQTSPASPAVFLWHLSSPTAGTYSYYEYVDSSTELSPGSAGPNQDLYFPHSPQGGGERIWDGAGSLDALITAAVAALVLGHARFTVLCSGDTAGTGGMRTSVRLATIAALPTNTPAGSGVGKTLTATVNGALSVDGTLVVLSDRVLVKNEAAPANNGVYIVTAPGDGSNPYVLTRTTDFDQVLATEVSAGAWVRVTAGGTLSNTYWQMTQTAAITIETTALTWAQLSTRFLRFWYSGDETPNLTQGTLGGTPSGQAGQLTRNVNIIEGVIADGATTFTFDWNAAGDGFTNGSPANGALRLGTS